MNVQSPLPGIPELTLQRHSDISLVDQIVQAIQQQIQNRLLKPGARLLSVGNLRRNIRSARLRWWKPTKD
jgi:DNA-binding FadR family transcriptional regulator